jgi:SAM-dependent methyltransferase
MPRTWQALAVAAIVWNQELADVYDETSAAMFRPHIVRPAVDLLEALTHGGPALEFAIGTGRIALPLSERGVSVTGIELSAPMVEQLRKKPGAERIHVTVGDMATTEVDGGFALVYLVWNTIMNLTTQAEQVAVFANAARHLDPGGHFVVEVMVPQLRAFPVGETRRVFARSDNHIGVETLDDFVGQITTSHHWMRVDGRLIVDASPFRYVWPSELDLMARLAGMRLVDRWSDWTKKPFTDDSTNQVAVYAHVAAD